jgi:hypothetical protein
MSVFPLSSSFICCLFKDSSRDFLYLH